MHFILYEYEKTRIDRSVYTYAHKSTELRATGWPYRGSWRVHLGRLPPPDAPLSACVRHEYRQTRR